MRKSPIIDMTKFGPIADITAGGFLDCSKNLCGILVDFYTRRTIPKKNRRILVYVSSVVDNNDNPYRIEIEKEYTFGYLLRMYKMQTGKPFDIETHYIDSDSKLEAYKNQGRKTMAWSDYGLYRHMDKLRTQEKFVQSLPKEKQGQQRKKFEEENGSPMLRIG